MAATSRQSTSARRAELLSLLALGEVNVHDLAQRLNVSISTIRRDLAHLEAHGDVTRTYGGALRRKPSESSWRDKETEQLSEKHSVAVQAASLVQSGDLVLLDAGTTCAQVAAVLAGREDITIMTNGLSPLMALADAQVEVIVMGGRLRRPNESFLGAQVLEMLTSVTPDIAFLGADALDPQLGLNCPDMEQAAVKKTMLERARESWIVADDTKVIKDEHFPYWVPKKESAGLILPAHTPEARLKSFTDHGWKVMLAA